MEKTKSHVIQQINKLEKNHMAALVLLDAGKIFDKYLKILYDKSYRKLDIIETHQQIEGSLQKIHCHHQHKWRGSHPNS